MCVAFAMPPPSAAINADPMIKNEPALRSAKIEAAMTKPMALAEGL